MNFEQTFRQFARHIHDIWPQISEEERAEHKELMRRFRMSNSEFRAIWYDQTTKAAKKRARREANAEREEEI